ncbi:MAG TPA: carboxypeptidase-like regulatory domain-containing protein, partial [Planctomycetota bacterium]|nr:carboxypeptidase-like regulatory domain-containing protein [Planctomycetota bacterium]
MIRTLVALALALILGLLGVLWLPYEAPAPTDPTGLQPGTASPDVHPLLDPRQSASERVIVEASRSSSENALEEATPTQAGAPGFLVRVQAPDGNPLSGARVQWIGPGASIEGTSDADGSCRLAWPPKGTRAELAVSAEGFFPHRQQHIAAETKITLYPLARLSGRVLDRESGAPIAGARLRVIWGRDGEPVVSDAAGRYDALAVPHGCSFPLSVEAHAYQQIITPLILRADDSSPAHDVLLDRALVARFVVLDLTSGEPLGGALVQGRSATYATDDEGLVEVDRSFRRADESHRIYVRAPGHCATVFELKDLGSLATPIPLRVPRSCRIEGVVLDPDGVAIRGIRVTASFEGKEFEEIDVSDGVRRPRRYPDWPSNAHLDLSASNHQREYTGELEQFAFDGFPAGLRNVRLEVHREDAVLARRDVGPLDVPGSIVRVEIRLEPPNGSIVRGKLLLNGEPVSGRVRWHGATLEGSSEVTADGRYELVDVEAGPVTLIGEPQTREMTLPKAGRAERRIQLERGAQVECDLAAELSMSSIGGRVVAPDGRPYAGAVIRLGMQSPAGSFKSTSGEDGTWTAMVPQTDAEFRVSTELVTQEGELVAHAGD